MQKFKLFTATTLALGLCLSLASCGSSEENITTNTSDSSTVEVEDMPLTRESYALTLQDKIAEYKTSSETLENFLNDFRVDMENEEARLACVEALKSATDVLYSFRTMEIPEDMAVLHGNMSDDFDKMAETYLKLADIYENRDLNDDENKAQILGVQMVMGEDLAALEKSMDALVTELTEET